MFYPDALIEAFGMVLSLETFAWIAIGVILGVAIGAIPGIGVLEAITLMLPVSILLPIAPALGLIIGVYKASIYGGSISAISFAIPGTPASAATVEDGYALTQKGQGRKALELALYASVTGDASSAIFTIIVAPTVAMVALIFGPLERFWLVVLAMVLIGVLSGRHLAMGLLSAVIGVFIATIGADPMGGVSRMTFGLWWLMEGVNLVPLMIGLFALPVIAIESSKHLAESGIVERAKQNISKSVWKSGPGLTIREYWRVRKEMGIGMVTGIVTGMLPGLGATAAAFLSLSLAKQASTQKKIGTGTLEGVAAPEAGNSATIGPNLIPLIAFGIPGSAAAALIGAALMLQGITPSPRMFCLFPHVIYTLFIILLIANVFLLVIGRVFTPFFAMLAQLPKYLLNPVILLVIIVGTYTFRGNPYDVILMLVFGLLGIGMVLIGMPIPPLIIGFMLGPIMEAELRRSVLIFGGEWGRLLVGSPIAIALIIATVALIFFTARYLKKLGFAKN